MSAVHGPFPGSADDGYNAQVWAGGGVVVDGDMVLLCHRPRYDDWTFPKGKLDPGETLAECALREVVEETGLVCELGEPVLATRYVDHKGRTKEVRYWLMTVTGGEFEPNDEVDEIAWVDATEAELRLSYARDLDVLTAAFE